MAGWSGVLRPKGHISPAVTRGILIAALLPIPIALCRMMAMPGAVMPLPGLGIMRTLGAFLNQYVVFDWSPPDDRSSILFLLLLPTGVLLVAFFRLTLGIRVLGLRAILLAMGFQAIGFLPSFVLMAAIVGTIVSVRPWLRRIRLPMYGRLTFIVCLAATMMIAAALLGPWLGSESLWRAAFFPAIIMAMIAEGVAKTIERDHFVVALWRGVWTIVLAVVLTLLDGPATRLSYQFPEVVLTQLLAIVLIAELLDLRLLEAWPDRLSRYATGAHPWWNPRPKVALVRNRGPADVIAKLGRPAPARYAERSAQAVVNALRERGFDVRVFEGDRTLGAEMARYLPPDWRRSAPGGTVLNLSTGVQGEGRFVQIPALLEMIGIAYTGPDPLGQARLSDRVALMTLLGRSQLPVPRQFLVDDPDAIPGVKLPALVRPRFEPDVPAHVATTRRALRNAARRIRRIHGQAAVVEQLVRGRKICVALVGNTDLEVLPLVEIAASSAKVCPAEIEEGHATRIRALARAAFRAAGCRDYARVDVKLPDAGDPVIVDVRWGDLFAAKGAFVRASEAAGHGLGGILHRIVEEAERRYANPADAVEPRTEPAGVLSLTDRRVAAGHA